MSMNDGLSMIGGIPETFYFKLARLSSDIDSSLVLFLEACVDIESLDKLILHYFTLKLNGFVGTLNILHILNPFYSFFFSILLRKI
jgi:hypothetical protein